MGRKNRPFYRIGAYDARTRRDGRPIEYVGHYDPMVDDFEKSVVMDLDRVKHWIDNGAKCSDTVASFVQRKGIALHRNARLKGRKTKGKGQPSARNG
jgi:small subunit ribosomal protein S16